MAAADFRLPPAPGPVLRDTTGARPQGPLWSRSRPGTRSSSLPAALPAEMREAVMALRVYGDPSWLPEQQSHV